MKKVILTLILTLSISTLLHAQWVNNPSGTIYTTTDNVGIGTTTPVAGLSTEAGQNAAIAPLTAVPNGSAWIGGSGTTGGISMGQFSGTYGYIQSRNKGTGSGAYKLALNPLGGFVGIGTAAPASALHVLDANATLLTLERFNSAGGNNIQYKNNAYTIYAGLDINGGFSVGTTANFSNSSVLTATSGGNVGVGTFTPAALLDIGKPINPGDLSAVLGRLSEGNATGGGTYLGVKGYNTQLTGTITDVNNVVSFAIEHSFYGVTNSSINFLRGSGMSGGSMSFNTNNNTEVMRLLSTGNVVIGKTSQTNTGYKLDVAGNVRANQIVVNTTGADFVFDPSYQLLPLSDLQKYIDKNHHLPEIAAAKQMQTEGLNVGDNQTKLLQKIEELTLYLIEKDKIEKKQTETIQLLESGLKQQQAQIDELKTQLKSSIKH